MSTAAGTSPLYHCAARPVRLDAMPTASRLMQALVDNGFDPGRAANGTADTVAAQGTTLRLQAIKLILHTVAAACRYGAKVRCKRELKGVVTGVMLLASTYTPGSRALQNPGTLADDALPCQGLCDLLTAVCHIGLDPCGGLLTEELEAGLAHACVVCALQEPLREALEYASPAPP